MVSVVLGGVFSDAPQYSFHCLWCRQLTDCNYMGKRSQSSSCEYALNVGTATPNTAMVKRPIQKRVQKNYIYSTHFPHLPQTVPLPFPHEFPMTLLLPADCSPMLLHGRFPDPLPLPCRWFHHLDASRQTDPGCLCRKFPHLVQTISCYPLLPAKTMP